ncbi:hypothetical protein C8J57DRAFT_1511084 [Mycena rebaudengoi]|nr:hypothetical protein C8J57DRAFT_1511084 [Mycena rebaudengoi]
MTQPQHTPCPLTTTLPPALQRRAFTAFAAFLAFALRPPPPCSLLPTPRSPLPTPRSPLPTPHSPPPALPPSLPAFYSRAIRSMSPLRPSASHLVIAAATKTIWTVARNSQVEVLETPAMAVNLKCGQQFSGRAAGNSSNGLQQLRRFSSMPGISQK